MIAAWRGWPLAVRVGFASGVAAVLWAIVTLDPAGAATVDPDATASVLYFQRIVGGHRLESFVPTTPKPFLTLLYGLTWTLLNDWRVLMWETVAAWGVAVGATATFVGLLADRVVERIAPWRSASGVVQPAVSWALPEPASPAATLAAGVFATAALLASSDLLLEVSRANSLVWALAGWSVAGVAVLLVPARPRVAGAALLLAGLCRFETLALGAVAVAAAIVVVGGSRSGGAPGLVAGIAEPGDRFVARLGEVRRRTTARLAVAAGLALAPLPIAMLHDWLLSGDPLYWLAVPQRYTDIYNPGLASIGPLTYAGTIAGRIAPEWLLLVAAAIGIVGLVRARLWLTLAGIAAIGLGVVLLLLWLALRATYISNRYYEPIDLALIVAAGVGVGWLAWRVTADRAAAIPVAAAVAVVLGGLATWPAIAWDRRATTELASVRLASANAGRLVPWIDGIRENLSTEPVSETTPTAGQPLVRRPATSFGLLVPSRDVSRLAVETGLGLDVVGDLYAAMLAGGVDGLRAGQWIIHDAAADRPVALFKPFEVDGPTGRVTPAADPGIDGVWIDIIGP